jgi:hypothetical protein
MRHDVDTALDRCLSLMRNGESIEGCLARYPEYADEMRPLLELVLQVGQVITPAPSDTARAGGEQRMLAVLAKKREREARIHPALLYLRRWLRVLAGMGARGLKPACGAAAVLLALLLVVGGGAAIARSTDSLPGDALYPLKKFSQQVQVALTFDPVAQERLQVRFREQERRDVQSVLQRGRRVSVEFQGVLERVEGDLWVVGGVPVTLQPTTIIAGQPSVGALVSVRGDLPGDGSLLATSLAVGPALTPWPTETPAPSQTPAPTQTPAPSPTVAPAGTPEPTRTPSPTATEEPTATAEPTEAPEWTATPEVGNQEKPAEAPDWTATPGPAEPKEPTEAPAWTATPAPEEPDEPDEAPAPTATPEPQELREKPTDTPGLVPTDRPSATPEPTEVPEWTATPEPTEPPEWTEAPRPTHMPEPTHTPHDDDDDDD